MHTMTETPVRTRLRRRVEGIFETLGWTNRGGTLISPGGGTELHPGTLRTTGLRVAYDLRRFGKPRGFLLGEWTEEGAVWKFHFRTGRQGSEKDGNPGMVEDPFEMTDHLLMPTMEGFTTMFGQD